MDFTQEQIAHIRTQIESGLQHPKLEGQELVGASFPCVTCMVGLNIVAGVPIGIAIAAGVAVAPEAAVCMAIAGFFASEAVTAAAVATVLNTVIAAGGGVGVEGALEALCEAFGAC